MVLKKSTGEIEHRQFRDLPGLLNPEDLLVLNDSKVIPGRFTGFKPTGGRVEITLIGKVEGNENLWRCLARPARRLKAGVPISIYSGGPYGSHEFQTRHHLDIIPVRRDDDGVWVVELKAEGDVMTALEEAGCAPLPPYIHRDNDNHRKEDIERYQTIYAREWGAVAAPTAGLHFTPELMNEIKNVGVEFTFITLDVGWGSFAPIREEIVEKHRVEAERFKVGEECAGAHEAARSAGGRVAAVGTTSVRSLESAWNENQNRIRAAEGRTDLFITPGYRFKAVDALVTNFHLPRSSLIMLVAAFAGLDKLLDAYKEAIRLRYRFYSYGDAMIIL